MNKKLIALIPIFFLSLFTSGCSSDNNVQAPEEISPWSTDIQLEEVVNTSQAKFNSWLKALPANQSYLENLHIYVDPTINADLLENLTAPLSTEITTLGDRGPKKYSVFISTSRKWIIDKIISLNTKFTDGKNPCGKEDFSNAIQGCAAGSDVIYLIIHDAEAIESNPLPLAVAVHEYFHLVQENYVNTIITKNRLSDIPGWLVEGSADWMGLAYYYAHYKLNYLETRTRYGMYEIPTAVSNPLSDYIINDPDTLFPYTIGRSAVELIVTFSGMEGLLSIFQNFGESGNFSDAFLKSTGKSIDEFYIYFELMRPKLGLPEPRNHLVCGDNSPINSPKKTCEPNRVSKKNSNKMPTTDTNKMPTTDISKASEGLACNGLEDLKVTSSNGVNLICKVESNGNTHWVVN